MSGKTWFQEKMAAIRDSFEFRFEAKLLALTEKICGRMEEKGISRTKLAERLSVSPAAITKLLRGSSNFTLRKLLTVADALEMDLKIDFEEKKSANYDIVMGSLTVCGFYEAKAARYQTFNWTLVNSGAAYAFYPEQGTSQKIIDPNQVTHVAQVE